MATVSITIDMDAKCAECGKGGRCDNGLCMPCSTNAIDPKRRMKSEVGRAVQARWQRIKDERTPEQTVGSVLNATMGDRK